MLIVEGDPIMARDLQRQFMHLGHTVLAGAFSGQEALAHMWAQRPDLVLMDIRLSGGMDVLAAGHAIQASYGCPVIYFSCNVPVDLARHSAPTRLRYYDVTPIGHSTLSRVLEATVAGSQSPQDRSASAIQELGAALQGRLSVLQAEIEEMSRNARGAHQQITPIRGQVKEARRVAGELPDAGRRSPSEAEQ